MRRSSFFDSATSGIDRAVASAPAKSPALAWNVAIIAKFRPRIDTSALAWATAASFDKAARAATGSFGV